MWKLACLLPYGSFALGELPVQPHRTNLGVYGVWMLCICQAFGEWEEVRPEAEGQQWADTGGNAPHDGEVMAPEDDHSGFCSMQNQDAGSGQSLQSLVSGDQCHAMPLPYATSMAPPPPLPFQQHPWLGGPPDQPMPLAHAPPQAVLQPPFPLYNTMTGPPARQLGASPPREFPAFGRAIVPDDLMVLSEILCDPQQAPMAPPPTYAAYPQPPTAYYQPPDNGDPQAGRPPTFNGRDYV